MGDEAEAIFEQVHPTNTVRYGLDRPPIQVWKLPPFIRYTPDYLSTKGLYEVQGCGQDGLIKVKHEKLEALGMWALVCPTYMFLWDRKNQAHCTIPVLDLVNGARNGVFREGEFPEGKKYWSIPVSWLTPWVSVV